MLLPSRDGAVLEVTVLGYEYPDAASAPLERGARHWLEATLRVQTPRGEGLGPLPFISLFDLQHLAKWLDQIAEDDPAAEPNYWYMEELNLQLRVLRRTEDDVTLHASFIIEPPLGFLHTADAKYYAPGLPYWPGQVDLEVARVALREAALSLRTTLQQLPDREPLW